MKLELINHIIEEKEKLYKEENLKKYIDLIQNKIYIKDPFDKAIATIFELVIEKEIDPLQIDLISFSKLYIEKVQIDDIDLFIAGKLILMAWKILRMQSEEMLKKMEEKEEEYIYEIPEWYGDDDIFTYTKSVMDEEIPLEKKIRRIANRKVSLVELINAFEEAREEIEKRRIKKKLKKIEVDGRAFSHAHKEDIEKDIEVVMEKLSRLNGGAIPMSKLCKDKGEIISVILPLLFLAKEGIITIWQEDFPYGEIYIKKNERKEDN